MAKRLRETAGQGPGLAFRQATALADALDDLRGCEAEHRQLPGRPA